MSKKREKQAAKLLIDSALLFVEKYWIQVIYFDGNKLNIPILHQTVADAEIAKDELCQDGNPENIEFIHIIKLTVKPTVTSTYVGKPNSNKK